MTELTHRSPPFTIPRVDLVARAEADPLRPRFHFVSPAGWLNDPNGVNQWGVVHSHQVFPLEGANGIRLYAHEGAATFRNPTIHEIKATQ